jgi:adenylyltransferase/sulfurtransferase
MYNFSPQEKKRYSRHFALSGFGMEAQTKLKNGSVLVVGAGGLGCPVLLYLTAAGVGKIGVLDDDVIDLSNLQRQILYTVEDVGKKKADVAAERLKRLNPEVKFLSYTERLTSANALAILSDYDVVVDGSDNFPTRYLVNDACVLLNKPFVYGSIQKFEGQVAVFNFLKKDSTVSSNYRDLFPNPPSPGSVLNCEEAGVLGVLPGMVGTTQANETIKILSGVGLPLFDKLLLIDAETMEQSIIRIRNQNSKGAIKGLIDYDLFCGKSQDNNKSLQPDDNDNVMKEVTVEELKELKESAKDFQLIDVREPHEYDICNLEGELIPMGQIPANVEKISKDKQVIMYCRSGRRSADIITWLEKNHHLTNLYNLKGGILAWAREIDPDMETY